jgi:lipopolysaccharide/colanic/teichoic acid biosynthesis glycosyltransferase
MYRVHIALIDVGIVVLAAGCAIALRDNLEFHHSSFSTLAPYVAASASMALPLVILLGLNGSLWRFSGHTDIARLLGAAVLIVTLATTVSFVWMRMNGIPRSLPVLHGILMLGGFVSVRLSMRMLHVRRQTGCMLARAANLGELAPVDDAVVIVGLNEISRLYLETCSATERRKIAGFVSHAPKHADRHLGARRVLGDAGRLDAILRELRVHGISVTRLLIVVPLSALTPEARRTLADIEVTTDVRIDFIETFFFGDRSTDQATRDQNAWLPIETEVQPVKPSGYHAIKRPLDIVAAATALVVLAPLILTVFIANAISLNGWPIFWQQRPGRNGRPIRVLKFRTMGAAHEPDGRVRSDLARIGAFGSFLRASRLDEMLQLVNVLKGDMSFVGPRPLLPCDQPSDARARLMIRPGITGYAQVHGGRLLGREEKAKLDHWYVENATLWLDLKIGLWTVRTIIAGDQKTVVDQQFPRLELAE